MLTKDACVKLASILRDPCAVKVHPMTVNCPADTAWRLLLVMVSALCILQLMNDELGSTDNGASRVTLS